jgi:hypothetical protein
MTPIMDMDGMMLVVRMVCTRLTDEELAITNLAAQLGLDPRGGLGYKKAAALFTEAGGTRLHPLTLEILAVVFKERFSKKQRSD